MLLSPEDAELFFKIHRSLMFYVNQRLLVVPNISSPDEFSSLPPETRLEVREAFHDEMILIEAFVDENPCGLAEDELDIVLSWHDQVTGKFFIFRELKKYTVFLSTEEPSVAYGVLALTEPFADMVGPHLPVWTETVLLPFKDKIIYDGLLGGYNISFGGGIKRELNESYKEAKERQGIVTSLPPETVPKPKKKKPRNPFNGRWRITWMEQWDQDFVDAEVEGYFEFGPDGMGSFHFGYVQGQIDHRPSSRDGSPCIDFTWEGNDEMHPAMGRGWVVLDGKEMNGMIYFHRGDESAFKAKKKK